MGILLWDNIGAKVRMIKSDIKTKLEEIDIATITDKLSDTLEKASDLSNKQKEINIRNFKEQLKNQPDKVILHNMNNAGTEEGRRICRDEARRRGIL
ncbi:hypothetical protein [Clostridium tertium]|uniref:hypothetical protein n=1 Tax=Clostridium tertium TaxID=1559 RepID=UPI00374F6879